MDVGIGVAWIGLSSAVRDRGVVPALEQPRESRPELGLGRARSVVGSQGSGAWVVDPLIVPAAHGRAPDGSARETCRRSGDPEIRGAEGVANRSEPFPEAELLVGVFGEAGRRTRSAVGLAELPFDIAVEVALTARLRPDRQRRAYGQFAPSWAAEPDLWEDLLVRREPVRGPGFARPGLHDMWVNRDEGWGRRARSQRVDHPVSRRWQVRIGGFATRRDLVLRLSDTGGSVAAVGGRVPR
jgi:hypothetical protein